MITKQLCLPNYLNPSTPTFIHLRMLVNSLMAKKSTKSMKNELINFVNANGPDAEKFVLLSIIQQIDEPQLRDTKNTSPKVVFLVQMISEFSVRDNFLFYFPEALGVQRSPPDYLSSMIKYLRLPIQTQIILALAAYLADNAPLAAYGQELLRSKLKEFYEVGKPVEFPERVMEELLFQIGKNSDMFENMQGQYQFLLDSNPVQKMGSLKCHHILCDNYRVYSYSPVGATKPSELIKKSQLLRDLGPYSTYSSESLKVVLNELGTLTEEDVFECLMVMSEETPYIQDTMDRLMTQLIVQNKKTAKGEDWRKFYQNQDPTEKKMQSTWNIDVFLTHVVQTVSNLKWTNVMAFFDRNNLEFASHEAFLNMFRIFQKAKKQGPKFKTQGVLFFEKWNHPKSQLVFLLNVFKCQQPDLLGLFEISNKKLAKWLGDGKNANLANSPYSPQVQLWGYLDLVTLLVELSDYNFMATRELLDWPMTHCPELLLQTLSQIRVSHGEALLDEVFSQLFPLYLSSHQNYTKLLEVLWENNEDLVISSICQLYKNENKKQTSCLNLSRVLDITQNIRESLIPLTNWNDYGFAVSLGILAGKREFLHFEQWVKQRLKSVGNPFLMAILNYIDENLLRLVREAAIKYGMNNPSLPQSYDIIMQKAQLSRELLAFVFESALQIPANKFSIRGVQKLKNLYKEIVQFFPQMSESQLPDEIEIQAEKQFHRIYREEISLEEAIQMMIQLKNSPKQEEKELYASMITFLFTELRFHSNYPEKELMITANFFAAIINANLIEKKLFNVFLQVLRDDLKLTNRKFDFAVTVIEKIKPKLSEEHDFCEALIDNQNLLSKNPDLVNQLINQLNPPINLSSDKALQLKTAVDLKNQPPTPPPAPVAEKTAIQTPVSTMISVPLVPNEISMTTDVDLLESQDKSTKIQVNPEREKRLNLLLNTMTIDSVGERSVEINKLLDSKEMLKWASYHIVFKRITTCGQPTSFEIFLNLINKIKGLQKPVLRLTYKILGKWFNLSGKSVNDKKLKHFKNLGFFLGKLTISRSEPVLIYKLNIKQIIISSYQQKSRLAHNIQVICKILECKKDSKYVYCTKNPWLMPILCVLKEVQDRVTENPIKSQITRLFKATLVDEAALVQTNYLVSCNLFHEGKTAPLTIAELPNFVQINQDELSEYISKGIDLRKIISQTLDAAIQEIVPPVIARSVTIALVTTKQLALKDFALEPDDVKLLRGTHLIVQNLAGSLALVTCREPLKMSLSNFLKKKLEEYNLTEQDKETIIASTTKENLDLGCALIKKAVIEKALEDINRDTVINEQLELRREAKALGKPFKNETYFIPQNFQIIPEQLRPKEGGLSEEQIKIYEDFQKDKKGASFIGPKERLQKLLPMIRGGEQIITIKQLLKMSHPYSELAQHVHHMLFESKDPNSTVYFIDILKALKEYVKPQEMYEYFDQNMPENINKKDFEEVVRELVKAGYFPSHALDDYIKKYCTRYYEDPVYQKQVLQMFESWLNLEGSEMEKYLRNISQKLEPEQLIKKFFYFILKHAVERTLESLENSYLDSIDFRYIDSCSKLIIIFLKVIENNRTKYLELVCESILMLICKFHDFDQRPFNQRPFFKLMFNLIYDVSRKSYDFDSAAIITMYTIFAKTLHKLHPLSFPGFSFAWLQLVSNKHFMPTILEKYEFCELYHELLLDLIKFAKERLVLEALATNEHLRCYYKGILRVVTMLLHDFPDFLSEFSLTLGNSVPDRFIQLRNVILSAFPKSLQFPEPQKISSLSELKDIENHNKLPKYYKVKFDKSFEVIGVSKNPEKLTAVQQRLQKESLDTISLYVLYVAWVVYAEEKDQTASEEDQLSLLIQLLSNANPAFLNNLVCAILNLIRFPNSITIFFIKLVTRILYDSKDTNLQAAFVKSIMERMKMEKPHPWGLIFVTSQMKSNKAKLVHLELSDIANL